MIETAFLIVVAAALFVANAAALRWGGNLFGRQRPEAWKAIVAVALVGIMSIATAWLTIGGGGQLGLAWYLTLPAAVVACAAIAFGVLASVFKLSQVQALRCLLLVAVCSLSVLGFAALGVPLLVAGYSVPTNGMAPAICGRHFIGKCPACGGEAIVSVEENWETRRPEPTPDRSICSQCFRFGHSAEINPELQMGDRIAARRWARPRRWDIVVFRFPEDRQQIFVKRLVGLPGETIQIKDGAIWINGQRQAPPPEIARLDRQIPPDEILQPEFATTQPLKLGPRECFVLGDNSRASYDSRFWGPLPVDDLRGVAWKVYFPPRAWKTFSRH